jgi:hypothetical protein
LVSLFQVQRAVATGIEGAVKAAVWELRVDVAVPCRRRMLVD